MDHEEQARLAALGSALEKALERPTAEAILDAADEMIRRHDAYVSRQIDSYARGDGGRGRAAADAEERYKEATEAFRAAVAAQTKVMRRLRADRDVLLTRVRRAQEELAACAMAEPSRYETGNSG